MSNKFSAVLKKAFQSAAFQLNREAMTNELLQAGREGDLDKIKELLGKGIPADAQNKQGKTVLMCASIKAHDDCVAFLLDAGRMPGNVAADATLATLTGETALHCAAAHGTPEIVERLIAAKANVNATVVVGCETPLMLAAREGHWDHCLLLLKAGADIGAVTSAWGQQAWDFARGNNHLDVEQKLVQWSQGKRDFDAPAPAAADPVVAMEMAATESFNVSRPLRLVRP